MAKRSNSDDTGRNAHQQKLPLTWNQSDSETGSDKAARHTPGAPDVEDEGDAGVAGRGGAPSGHRKADSREVRRSEPAVGDSRQKEAGISGGDDHTTVVELEDDGESVGRRLLNARAEAGLTTAEVSARTNITREFIENLEMDQYGKLPPIVCSRGQLLMLCEEYSLESAPLVEDFEKAIAEVRQEGTGGVSFAARETEAASHVTYELTGADDSTKRRGGMQKTSLILVRGIILILVLVVISAIVVQVRRMGFVPGGSPEGPPDVEELGVDLRQFVAPEQLQIRELPLPGE